MSLEITSDISRTLQENSLSLIERAFELILGKKYSLSLAFITKEESYVLNKKYRSKESSTNILSFPLSNTSGEILIDLDTCREQFESFNMSFDDFIVFLFIHGCSHLRGYEHGEEMDQYEKIIQKDIGLFIPNNEH